MGGNEGMVAKQINPSVALRQRRMGKWKGKCDENEREEGLWEPMWMHW